MARMIEEVLRDSDILNTLLTQVTFIKIIKDGEEFDIQTPDFTSSDACKQKLIEVLYPKKTDQEIIDPW